MSFEEPTPSASERALTPYVIIGAIAAALILLVSGFIYFGRTSPRASSEVKVYETDKLEAARRDLIKTTDPTTCRNAIQQINLYVSDHAKQRPPALSAEQRAFLSDQCLGDPTEMAEVEGTSYTLLDAHHMAECYLFRDVAQTLEVSGRPAAEQ